MHQTIQLAFARIFSRHLHQSNNNKVLASNNDHTERTMIIRATSVMVLALLLQVEAVMAVAAAVTQDVQFARPTDATYAHEVEERTILTQPILPHHAILDRRHQELRSLGLSQDEAETEMHSIRRELRAAAEDRPHTYPRRNLADKEHQEIGALYQGYGTHYVDLWVGTPPQRQTVIVDTGSGVTAFPCSACNNCGESYHTDSYFIEADSSTFQKLNCDSPCARGRCTGSGADQICRISMSYQEGSSWAAYEAVDQAYAGGMHDKPILDAEAGDGMDPHHASNFAFPLTFGCQTSLTGLFKTQLADGIMGMDNADTAFWNQMHKQNAIPEAKFSLCFNRQPLASRDGTMAGALTLGGQDARLHSSPMLYADNTRGYGFYTVRLKKMYMRAGGGESALITDDDVIKPIDIDEATLNTGGVIVDSGTTDTYMTRTLAQPFKKLWEEVAGRKFSHDAIKLTDEQLRSLPTIFFQLEGAKDGSNDDLPTDFDGTGLAEKVDPSNPKDVLIAMPASHYMEYDTEKEVYTARLYLEEGSGSVLGANAMMGHDVLFDVDNKRVGWAESDCDYFELIGVEVPALDNVPEKIDSEKKEEDGFEDVDPGQGDGTATGEDIKETNPYVAGVEDLVEQFCPSTGCKVGIAAGVLGMIVALVAYNRYRASRYGIESLPLENVDLDLQEEVDYETEMTMTSSGPKYSDNGGGNDNDGGDDDDNDDSNNGHSEFSIT